MGGPASAFGFGSGWLGQDGVFLAFITLVPFAARLAFAATLPLTEDEAYYRLWALAPALSYLDHPPMVGWMMAAGLWVAGDSALGLRLPGILATAVSTIVIWRIASLLTDRETARVATVFAAVIPLLSVGAVVMTPDTPSVLFFVLGAWALAELNASGNANLWLAVGVAAGLGLLSKYTNFFFGVSIVVWLAMARQNWRWFKCWQLYAGGAMALALFAPVIAWNLDYGGASFAKQFGRVVDVDGLKLVRQLEMWGALLLLLSPVIFYFAARGLIDGWGRFRRQRSPRDALLLALTAPLLVYFFLHALRGRVLPNWLAPVYPFLAILAAAYVTSLADPVARRRSAIGGALVALVLTLAIHAHAMTPFYVKASAREPTHQLRGWPEFSAAVEARAEAIGARYIGAVSYGTTGHLAASLDRRWRVHQVNERLRYVHLPMPDEGLLQEEGLVVDLVRRRPQKILEKRFAIVEPLGTLARSYRGEALQTYALFRVAQPVCDWREAGAACDK